MNGKTVSKGKKQCSTCGEDTEGRVRRCKRCGETYCANCGHPDSSSLCGYCEHMTSKDD